MSISIIIPRTEALFDTNTILPVHKKSVAGSEDKLYIRVAWFRGEGIYIYIYGSLIVAQNATYVFKDSEYPSSNSLTKSRVWVFVHL